MIDISTEKLVSLTDAARRLPKRPHVSTLFRWAYRGLRGHRLEVIKQGGSTYTSEEALQRFFDCLTAREPAPPVTIQGRPAKATSRHRQATQELDKFGF